MPTQEIDPRKAGIQGLRGLRGINQQSPEDTPYIPTPAETNRAARVGRYASVASGPIEFIGGQFEGLGDSRYDRKITSEADLYNLGDYRANSQSSLLKITNGIIKGGVLAGTTFLDGTIGLATGIGTAITEQRFSGIWDNDFSKMMKEVNDAAESTLPNYYTQDEIENPMAWRNIFSSNFLGDKFIKNIGFTVGAFYSGNLFTKPLTLINALKNAKFGSYLASTIGAGISAVNEGRIEALNNSTDWYNLHKQQLDDEFQSRLQNLQAFSGDPVTYDNLVQKLNDDYTQRVADLDKARLQVGNRDFELNLPILLASNLIEFASLYAKGFDTAARNARVSGTLGSYMADFSKVGRAAAGVKSLISEGSEELAQDIASRASGKYIEKRLQLPKDETYSYFEAGINDDSTKNITNWINDFGQAITESVSEASKDPAFWEQGIIGGLTGALGMPTFGRANNANAWLGKNKIIGLSGGAVGSIQEYNQNWKDSQDIANTINEGVNSGKYKAYYQGLVRRDVFENLKAEAADRRDKKAFHDSDFAELVSNALMFSKVGKLDDYTSLIKSSLDTSDENLDTIIKATTSADSGVGAFLDADGNPITATEKGKEEMIKYITQRTDQILDVVNKVRDANNFVNNNYGDTLSEEVKDEIVWLKVLGDNQIERATDLTAANLPKLQELIADRLDELQESEEKSPKVEEEIQVLNSLRRQLEARGERRIVNIANNLPIIADLIQNRAEALDRFDEIRELATNLIDIRRLVDGATAYRKQFEEAINNPDNLQKKLNNAKKKEKTKATETAKRGFSESLNTATSVDDVRKAALDAIGKASTTEEETAIEEALASSKNPAVKSFRDIRSKINEAKRKIASGEDATTQAGIDATALLDKLMNLATSVEDVVADNEIFIDPSGLNAEEGETPEQLQARIDNARRVVAEAFSESKAGETTIDDAPPPDIFDDPIPPMEDPPVTGSSESPSIPPANKPEKTSTGTDIENIHLETSEFGEGAYTTKETINQETASGTEEIKEINSEEGGQTHLDTALSPLWRPATAEFDLTGMNNGEFVAHSNEVGRAVHDYIEAAGGYEFVNSGELFEYAKKKGKIYYGIDPNFNPTYKETAGKEGQQMFPKDPPIFMYVKTGTEENPTYIPIGNSYMADSKTSKFTGLQDFVKEVLEGYDKASKDSLYIHPNKTSTVKTVYSGRVPFSSEVRTVKEALGNTQGTTSPDLSNQSLMVVTTTGVTGKDSKTREIKNQNSKIGNAYIKVPNAKKGYTPINVIPAKVSSDILNTSYDKLPRTQKRIQTFINDLASAILEGDSRRIGISISLISDYINLSNLEISRNPGNGKIYFNDRRKAKGEPGRTVGSFTYEGASKEDIAGAILRAITEGVHAPYRIKATPPSNLTNAEYAKELIESDILLTHATALQSKSAWFEVTPASEDSTPPATPTAPKKVTESTPAEPTPTVKRRGVLAGMKVDPKKAISTSAKVETTTTTETPTNKIIKEEAPPPSPMAEMVIDDIPDMSEDWEANATPDEKEAMNTCSKIFEM